MTLSNIWYQNVAFVLGNIQKFFGIFKLKIKKWPVIPISCIRFHPDRGSDTSLKSCLKSYLSL